VFDLRGNPGGYIESARKIASEFVNHGLIFSQESSGGDVKRWEALPDYGLATSPSIPLAVLVDNGSASASEIVSAALKELGRATIIGQHTFGKNTVQVWAPLTNDGGVRITISRWFTPDHHSVHPGGVVPTDRGDDPEGNAAGPGPGAAARGGVPVQGGGRQPALGGRQRQPRGLDRKLGRDELRHLRPDLVRRLRLGIVRTRWSVLASAQRKEVVCSE